MILKTLEFSRGYSVYDGIKLNPLRGKAVFHGDAGEVALALTDADAEEILKICTASMQRILRDRALEMENSMAKALETNAKRKIGREIPGDAFG